MDDEVLTIHETWPGTTIDGEPGFASGLLVVSGVLLGLVEQGV